jgi:hypothetical protein
MPHGPPPPHPPGPRPPASARADIPPDPDSADANCSKALQCPNGEFCPYAFNPRDNNNESELVGLDCRGQMAHKGLEKRCRNGGNYSGDELYCPPGETGSWSQARPAQTRAQARTRTQARTQSPHPNPK